MDHHPRHAQGFGHQTGMLPSRPTKALKRIGRDIMAALDANFLDRIGHILHGNIQKALRHIFCRPLQTMLCRQGFDPCDSRLRIQGQCAGRTKNSGKIIRRKRAQDHIAIRDS